MACVNAGWQCPGYWKRWKFVHENERLALAYRNKKHLFDDNHADDPFATTLAVLENGVSPGPSDSDIGPGELETYRIHRRGHASYHVGVLWAPASHSESDKTARLFARILSAPQDAALFALQTVGPFLPYIPGRLGRNAALDQSVACLCSIYMDVMTGSSSLSNMSIKRYASSLKSLQQFVENEGTRFESETVGASILLQLCEVCCVPTLLPD